MSTMHVRRFAAAALAGVFLLAGCDDSPTVPPTQVATEVEVTPDEVSFTALGQTEELVAVVFDAGGIEIDEAEVTWSSDDETVATVDEAGTVEAVGEGTATITATSGDASGSASVSVEIDD